MSMTKAQVLTLLKENQNERGIAHWKKKPRQLKSYGIGLTQLRKLAKQIGRDHKLAQQLWKSNIYDAKVVGLLVDDPKQLSREQAEELVENLQDGMLAHVFASCNATLAKTPYAFELARDWIESKDAMRRHCGYSLLYELSKKNPKGMDEAYLLGCINHIRNEIADEENWVQGAMGGALIGIGKRSKKLNKAAIDVAKSIDPIYSSCGDEESCAPLNILKHLTSDYLKKKLEK